MSPVIMASSQQAQRVLVCWSVPEYHRDHVVCSGVGAQEGQYAYE
jgi:hypothetical protein